MRGTASLVALASLVAGCPSGPLRSGDASPDRDADTAPDGGSADADGPGRDADSDGGRDGGRDGEADGETPPPERAFDLDGDGRGDTDLELSACTADPAASCLDVRSDLFSDRQVLLAAGPPGCAGTIAGPALEAVGDYGGDGLSEVSAAFCPDPGGGGAPVLAVVDVAAATVIGAASAPGDHGSAWVDSARDPAGLRHPFLAPSYGDGDTSGFYGSSIWGRLCLFRPDLPADPACGTGFASASAAPAATFFREVGGTVQDLDLDGWDDVTLIFHATAHTVSTASLAVLSTTVYDVAASTEPGSPPLFHSGRSYGTHAAVVGGDGARRTVIVGGAPVGAFSDVNCNVSRFVAVLETPAGAPASRRLAWSDYLGFASTIFSAYSPAYAGDPSPVVARAADVMDGCIHRFSDSRTVMDGEEVVVFDYFVQSAPADLCLSEQYQLYLDPAWTEDKQRAWNECFALNLGARGVWGVQVRSERDGGSRTGSLGTYVWGRATTLRPEGEPLYLVELLPGEGRFDLADRSPSPLSVLALVGGFWTDRGTFPVAGRPALRHEPARGARGVGSYTAYEELTLEDRDGDGLDDVQLEDGTWVGYSVAGARFEIKP